MNRATFAALLIAVIPFASLPADEPAEPADPEASAVRHVLVIGSNRPWVVEIRLTVEGKSHREHWEAWLAERFAEHDENGNGHLDGEEIGKVVRQENQNAGNAFLDFFRKGNAAAVTGDEDGDGVISLEEFAAHRRDERRGEFRIEEETTPGVDLEALSIRVATALDTNGDEMLSRAELENAIAAATSLDRNEDELVTLAEVNSGAMERPVFVLNAEEESPPEPEDVIDLPSREDDMHRLARRLESRYRGPKSSKPGLAQWELKWPKPGVFALFDTDGSGRLEEDELVAFLRDPIADLRVTVGFRTRRWWRRPPQEDREGWFVEALPGTQMKPINVFRTGGRRFRVVTGGDSVEFLPPQSINQSRDNLVSNYEAQFDGADGDNNEYLDEDECRRQFYFQNLFERLDADGNEKIFKDELVAFIERESVSARTRTRLIVANRGRNLYDLLDGNRNGTITPRELVQAVPRAMSKDTDKDGQLADDEVPRFLRITVQPGRPDFGNVRYLLGGQGSATNYVGNQYRQMPDAPKWFRGMDRNQDGDVSRAEFLGPAADFTRLDTDADGLLSVDEAKVVNAESASTRSADAGAK